MSDKQSDRAANEERSKRSLAMERLANLRAQNREPIRSNWRGVVRYECPFENCAFDHTSEPVMIEHISVVHPAPSEEDIAAWEALAAEDRLPEDPLGAPEVEYDEELHAPGVTDEQREKILAKREAAEQRRLEREAEKAEEDKQAAKEARAAERETARLEKEKADREAAKEQQIQKTQENQGAGKGGSQVVDEKKG